MRSVRLLALVAATLAAAPALAQDDQFPDVPRNHWAYEALARMKKDGLLVGYPDGLYRGGRPMSRYELAVAMHAAYTNLKNVTDGLLAQVTGMNHAGDHGDAQALKDVIAALQTEIAKLKGYGADLADLQRATDTVELELNQLGVDVQAMKDGLKGLAGRVKTLEAKRPALDVHGDLNLWVGGGHAANGTYGLTRDGRLTGTRIKGAQVTNEAVSRAGITDDAAFLTEAAFRFETTSDRGPRARGTLVLTNLFGQNPLGGPFAFGNQSDVLLPNGGYPGLFGYAEGSGDVYLQDLVLAFNGPRLDVEVGRVAHRATPWVFQRIDNTLYFDNARWDDGQYRFDGAVAKGHLGRFELEGYGGSDHPQTVNGFLLNPLQSGFLGGAFVVGRLPIDRHLGGTVSTRVRGVGLRGDALVLKSDIPNNVSGPKYLDALRVFGGEADFRLGRVRVAGGLRQSQAYDGDDRVGGGTGTAWDVRAAFSNGPVDLALQYREVQTAYAAPGDWGRLGVLRNPTNLRGFIGKARYGFASRYTLSAEGEVSRGISSSGAAATRFDGDTEIGRVELRLDAKFGRDWDAYVRYENTGFSDLAGAATSDARYQWYGVGVAKEIGANAFFSLAYEQSAIRNDFQTLPFVPTGLEYRGGFLTSQVTIRF